MLRLVMLYALRYESHSNNDISGLLDVLRKKGVSDKQRSVGLQIINHVFSGAKDKSRPFTKYMYGT